MLKPNQIKGIKARYPKGTRIELIEMRGETRMTKGLTGRVILVDDIGQIHVHWENGSGLALMPGEDEFKILPPEKTAPESMMPQATSAGQNTDEPVKTEQDVAGREEVRQEESGQQATGQEENGQTGMCMRLGSL